MEIWKDILPVEDYYQYLDEGASVLSDMSATMEDLNDTNKEAWYQLGRKTRRDFEVYRQAKRYKELYPTTNLQNHMLVQGPFSATLPLSRNWHGYRKTPVG